MTRNGTNILNIPSKKSKQDKSVGSTSRTLSSDSIYPTDKGTKLHDKILIRVWQKVKICQTYVYII